MTRRHLMILRGFLTQAASNGAKISGLADVLAETASTSAADPSPPSIPQQQPTPGFDGIDFLDDGMIVFP